MMADPLQATAEWPAVLAAAQWAQTSREVIARYTRVNVVMSTLKRTMYHCSRVWGKEKGKDKGVVEGGTDRKKRGMRGGWTSASDIVRCLKR